MLTRPALVLALIASLLTIPLATGSTSAAPTQQSIWNASGLQQTMSSYWQPTLNQPNDYTSPVDFAGGNAYMRLDVVSKPSDMYVVPLICFWRHGTKQFQEETCAAGRKHPFTSEGTYYLDLKTPAAWWKKNGTFDWSKPVSVGRIMIRDGVTGGKLLLSSRCGAACYTGDDLGDHVPIKMNAHLIFVAEGEQLNPPSDWRAGCPGSWAGACNGSEPTPATTAPPTTASPTTSPTTTPATTSPATTQPAIGSAFIAAVPGPSKVTVTYGIPGAMLYQVRYAPDGGTTVWTSPANSTTQTLTGLTPGTRYTFEVRGYVNKAWRNWISTVATPSGSATTATTTTTTTPTSTTSPPTSGTAVDGFAPGTARLPSIDVVASSNRLTVTAQLDGAGLFQVRSRPTGTNGWTWREATQLAVTTLNGLKNGVQYDVQVRAFKSSIWQPWNTARATPGR